MSMNKTIIVALTFIFATAASAQQYKWSDQDGKVRYGDVPPAGSNATRLRSSSGGYAPPASTPAPKSDAAKAQEQPQKQAMTEEQIQIKRDNCARAQETLRTLQSGQRIARIDSKGERYYLDEAQIAQETGKARQAMQQWCS
jgi:hypothetical protein